MKDFKFAILNELYGGRLSVRQSEIIKNYYDFDLSFSEIADNFGVTRQAVCDALKKGEKTLLKLEEDVGFLAKMGKIKAELEDAIRDVSADDSALKRKLEEILDLF